MMHVGSRKLLAASGAALILAAGITAALAGELAWLGLLILVSQIAAAAGLAWLVLAERQRLERRFRTIGTEVADRVEHSLGDERFLADLRSAALPQRHADQLIRTIEARHVHLETYLQQIERRLDELQDTLGSGQT